ncbi:NUDIX domain-containing protein [Tranquillimonas rosea]|nr:NUDIX hydrolase [Tranquillimonas rosea]
MTIDEFNGAKLALIAGDRIATILRDDRPDIPFPGLWDLPGGGREADESPLDCVLRETREEIGLIVPAETVRWQRAFDYPGRRIWFLVAEMGTGPRSLTLGDEGRAVEWMALDHFLSRTDAVPHLQQQLRTYLDEIATA